MYPNAWCIVGTWLRSTLKVNPCISYERTENYDPASRFFLNTTKCRVLYHRPRQVTRKRHREKARMRGALVGSQLSEGVIMNRKWASQELEHTVPFTYTPALALSCARCMTISKSQLLWASLSGAVRWEDCVGGSGTQQLLGSPFLVHGWLSGVGGGLCPGT